MRKIIKKGIIAFSLVAALGGHLKAHELHKTCHLSSQTTEKLIVLEKNNADLYKTIKEKVFRADTIIQNVILKKRKIAKNDTLHLIKETEIYIRYFRMLNQQQKINFDLLILSLNDVLEILEGDVRLIGLANNLKTNVLKEYYDKTSEGVNDGYSKYDHERVIKATKGEFVILKERYARWKKLSGKKIEEIETIVNTIDKFFQTQNHAHITTDAKSLMGKLKKI